ncbi:hypothetical protein [Phaffia rhodozyma]|uniref:Uncharacterized protein n=1 Tax=Phaffia rhodozyma TaxID=264483 RepID=A0A0F7SPZ9_PHARH|nr:hypothetical protein [Phaffia rhodozyma]
MNQFSSLPILQPPSVVSFSDSSANHKTSPLGRSSICVLSSLPNSSVLTDRLVQNLVQTQTYHTTGSVDEIKTPVKLTTRLKSYLPSSESIKRLRPIKSFSKLKHKALGSTTKSPIVSTSLFTSLDLNVEVRPNGARALQSWSHSTASKSTFRRPGLSSCIRPGLSLDSPPGLNVREPANLDGDLPKVIEIVQNPLLGKLSFEQQSINSRMEQTRAEREREAWKKRKSKTGVSWEERLEVLDVCRGEISFGSKAGETHEGTRGFDAKADPSNATSSTKKNSILDVQTLPEIVRSNRIMNRRLSRHGLRPSKSFDLDSRLPTIECSPPTSPTNSLQKLDDNSVANSNLSGHSILAPSETRLTWARQGYRRQVRVPRRIASAISLPPLIPIPPLDPTPPNFPIDESPKPIEHTMSNPIGALSYSSASRPSALPPSSVGASPQTDMTTVGKSQPSANPSTVLTPINTQLDRPGSIWRSQIIGRYYDTSGFLEGSESEIDPSPLKGLEYDLARIISSDEGIEGAPAKKDRNEDLPPRLELHETFSPILFSLDFSLTSENAEHSGSFPLKERLESQNQKIFTLIDPIVSPREDPYVHIPRARWLSMDAQSALSAVNPFCIATSDSTSTVTTSSNATNPEFLKSLCPILPYHTSPSPSSSCSPHRTSLNQPLHEALPLKLIAISLYLAQPSPIIDPMDVPLPSSPMDEISGFSFSAYSTLWTPPRQSRPQSHHILEPISTYTPPITEADQADSLTSSLPSSPSLSATSSIIDESGDLSISSNLEAQVKFGTASRLTSSVPRVIYQPSLSAGLNPLLKHYLHNDHVEDDNRRKDGEEGSDDESGYKYHGRGSDSDQDLSPCVARSVFLSSRVTRKPTIVPQTWKSPSPSKPSGRAIKAGPVTISPSAGMSFTPSFTSRERNRSSFRLNSSLIAEFGQGALSTSTPTTSEVSLQMFRRRIKDVLEAGIEEVVKFQVDFKTHDEVGHIGSSTHAKYSTENKTTTYVSTVGLSSPTTPYIDNQRQRQGQMEPEDEFDDEHGNSSDLGSTGREIMRLAREKGQSKLLKRAAGRSIRNKLASNRGG